MESRSKLVGSEYLHAMVLLVTDDHVAGLVVDGEALEALELARLASARAKVAHVGEVVGPEDLDARVSRQINKFVQ